MRYLLISPSPFASVRIGQVVSVGMGLIDDTQPASEGAPGWHPFPGFPALRRKQPVPGSAHPPCSHRNGPGCREGPAQEDESPHAAYSLATVFSLQRGRPGVPWGPSRSQGHGLSPLVSVLDIWPETWLTAEKMDETIHRATDFVKGRSKHAHHPCLLPHSRGGESGGEPALGRAEVRLFHGQCAGPQCTPTGILSHYPPPGDPRRL